MPQHSETKVTNMFYNCLLKNGQKGNVLTSDRPQMYPVMVFVNVNVHKR